MTRVLMTTMLTIAAAFSFGCVSHYGHGSGVQDPDNRYHGDAEARGSLVIPTRQIQQARLANEQEARLPWYAGRNDARLGVDAGVQSATYEQVSTFTTDYQSIHGDHVYDNYTDRTYRSRVYQTVR